MLIVDDDNNLENNDKFNILDLRGNSIKIPTLIIPRNYGDIIKNYIYEQKTLREMEPLIVNIKFSAYNPDTARGFLPVFPEKAAAHPD